MLTNSNFRRILEALSVEWRNSTPRFASTPERRNRNYQHYNQSRLQSDLVSLRHDWPRWNSRINIYIFFSYIVTTLTWKGLELRSLALPPNILCCRFKVLTQSLSLHELISLIDNSIKKNANFIPLLFIFDFDVNSLTSSKLSVIFPRKLGWESVYLE